MVGFLIGLGFANYPVNEVAGHPPAVRRRDPRRRDSSGTSAMWTSPRGSWPSSTWWGSGCSCSSRGLDVPISNRGCCSPTSTVFGANQYLTLVSLAKRDDDGDDDLGAAGAVRHIIAGAVDDRLHGGWRSRGSTLTVLAAHGRRGDPAHDEVLRRFQTGWTGYQPLGAQGTAGSMPTSASSRWSGCRCACWVRPDRDDHRDARAGDDLVAAADLRVGGVRDRVADDAGGADADRRAADGGVGSHPADRVLHSWAGR